MALASETKVVVKGFGYEVLIRTKDPEHFERVFDARRSAMRDFSEPLARFGQFLVDTHIPYQFSSQGAPDPWSPLSPQYAVRKFERWGIKPVLIASGAMYRGFAYRVSAFLLAITNSQFYADFHLTGTIKMPARKWMQLKDNDLGYGKLRLFVREHVLESYGVEE